MLKYGIQYIKKARLIELRDMIHDMIWYDFTKDLPPF